MLGYTRLHTHVAPFTPLTFTPLTFKGAAELSYSGTLYEKGLDGLMEKASNDAWSYLGRK